MTKRPLKSPPRNVRQRARADGSVRIWWEPSAAARALGFAAVELDARRLTWSVRAAEKLNQELEAAQRSGGRAAPAPSGRSIAALIDKYTRSRKFRDRAEKTQASYRKQFALIERKWGTWPVIEFTKPAMNAWYEALLDERSTATAIARLRHMSILMSYAELIGWRPENSNPCAKLGMTVPKGRRRVVTWTELDALIAAATGLGYHSVVTAIVISLYQGQRQEDIRRAMAGDFQRRDVQLTGWNRPRRMWAWALTRNKRGNEGAMIVHPDVVPVLEAAIAAAQQRIRAANPGQPVTPEAMKAEPLLIDEAHGTPFTGRGAEDRWQNRFRATRDAAIEAAAKAGADDLAESLATLQFRDLRRSFGALSRAAGTSRDDTADVLGNSAATDQLLADIYMAPSFETASRAVMSISRPAHPSEDQPKRKKA